MAGERHLLLLWRRQAQCSMAVLFLPTAGLAPDTNSPSVCVCGCGGAGGSQSEKDICHNNMCDLLAVCHFLWPGV